VIYMKDHYAEDLSHGGDFDHPFHALVDFTGTKEHSYQDLVEILKELEELESMLSKPERDLINLPRHHWSRAPIQAFGIDAEDLHGSDLISHIQLTLMSHQDRPRNPMAMSCMELIEQEEQALRAEWKNSEWLPYRDCSNRNAEAYLRHLSTSKELVWSKDAYKTSYFMVKVLKSFSDLANSDLPVKIKGSGFTFITTSKLILDLKDPDTVETVKKLKTVLKKMSLTQASKDFFGESFMSVVDNTNSARPPLFHVIENRDSKLILEMKLNPLKKTVFFVPIGVANKA